MIHRYTDYSISLREAVPIVSPQPQTSASPALSITSKHDISTLSPLFLQPEYCDVPEKRSSAISRQTSNDSIITGVN